MLGDFALAPFAALEGFPWHEGLEDSDGGQTYADERSREEQAVPPLRLIRRSFPDDPELGTAVSRAILTRVAADELPATMRVHRPAREVAFGRQDVAAPGYPAAREAARAAGFAPVERLAGGRAAVFHEGTIAFARAFPDPEPPKRTYERFMEMAKLVADALRRMGVDARIGEVPGEYCPGAYSVNAKGRRKLSGIGQRMIRGAAHVGGVIVVSGEDLVRDALVPVYQALDLEWDPGTSGSIAAELGRDVTVDEAIEAVVAELGAAHDLEEADVDDETMALARSQS
jgi:lipoate-protein ligase A